MISGTSAGLKINFQAINMFPDTMKYITENLSLQELVEIKGTE